jgi:hypothetical protein
LIDADSDSLQISISEKLQSNSLSNKENQNVCTKIARMTDEQKVSKEILFGLYNEDAKIKVKIF